MDVSDLVEVANVADFNKSLKVEKFWRFCVLSKISLEKIILIVRSLQLLEQAFSLLCYFLTKYVTFFFFKYQYIKNWPKDT